MSSLPLQNDLSRNVKENGDLEANVKKIENTEDKSEGPKVNSWFIEQN